MSSKAETQDSIGQNLRDAGCSEAFICQFLCALEEKTPAERQKLLSLQRGQLLEQMHECQRKLDCLDYLRYSLQKQDSVRTEERKENTP